MSEPIDQINAYNAAYADGYAEHIQHGWNAANPYRPHSSLGVSWRKGRMAAIHDLEKDDKSFIWNQLQDIDLEMHLAANKAIRAARAAQNDPDMGLERDERY